MRSNSSLSVSLRYAIAAAIIIAALLAPALLLRPAIAAENAPDTPDIVPIMYLPFVAINGGGADGDAVTISPPVVFDPCGSPIPDGGVAPTSCDPPIDDQ